VLVKVIAVIGQKGGSGKTTLTENLAVEASAKRKTVAIIDLDSQPSAASWSDRRQRESPVVVSDQVARLGKVLSAARDQGTDLAVIDTPPRMAEATIEAARAANLILIPLRPLINDVETLPALAKILQVAGSPKAFVVLNAASVQGQRDSEARQVAEGYGFSVCPVVLHQRSAYGDAPVTGLAVREFEPDGKAADEIAHLYDFVKKQIHI